MSSDYEFSDDDDEYYDGMDMDDDEDVAAQDDGECSSNPRIFPYSLICTDSAISEDDIALMMPRDGGISAGKRKACEVEFDAMPQEVVERLIRKDVDHISSIFGVSVSHSTCPGSY